jgi:hypothetical protein
VGNETHEAGTTTVEGALMTARPARVRRALIVLWAAWLLTATALLVNQFLFDGSGIGPGLTLGIVSLAVQAMVFVFIGRASVVARALAVAFLVLAALPVQMVPRLITEGSFFSATYTAFGFALKAIAVILLFTGDAKTWFAARR